MAAGIAHWLWCPVLVVGGGSALSVWEGRKKLLFLVRIVVVLALVPGVGSRIKDGWRLWKLQSGALKFIGPFRAPDWKTTTTKTNQLLLLSVPIHAFNF
jgi:hypothetical protein